MEKAIGYVPRVAIFLAGVAAGVLARRELPAKEPSESKESKGAIQDLERRIAAQEAATAKRFEAIDTRLDEQAAKLAEVPTTAQIVSAMEGLLAKTMTSLDERLTTQAHSIDVLKSTVSQTDNLLERVLESLDTLQTYSNPAELAEDGLLQRAV